MSAPGAPRLERRPAVARLLRDRADLLVVAGLGSAVWDVEAAGENPLNFYLLGAMGSVVSTAAGLAIARPERPVLALAGDADLMMTMGALATVAARRPRNLTVVCIDNERFGETGSQRSHTGFGVDLAAVGAGCGLPVVERVTDTAGVEALRDRIHRVDGPVLGVMKVTPDLPPVVMPIRDGAIGMARFREALLGPGALKA